MKLSIIKLKNYVFELNAFTSVTARFGSRKISLLLNDSSHEPHFSACQNMKPQDGTQKISNFFLHRFSRYSTLNMALQKIILTSFLFFLKILLCNIFNGSTSVLTRHGSRKIFLLLNDSSHDPHFFTRQNMAPENFLEEKSNFSLHEFSRYLTPNMVLQKIILTSFFVFLLLPDRGICVLHAITSRRY